MATGPVSDSARLQSALARWFAELTHHGIVATDRELRVIVWNRWMELHARLPASDAFGRPLIELFPDLAARELDQRYREAIEHGRVSTVSYGLHRHVFPLPPTHPDLDFAEMPQSGRIGPLMDGDAIIGTVTTIEDVSERLASEAQLRKQIEAQQIARAAAETALRSKDEFLSTLSHELRTPLNAVLGWTRLLVARQDNDPAVVARALQVIERNATAQASMIDDILDVARIVAGKLRLEMQPIDLLQVVLSAVDVVTPSAKARRIAIRTSLDPKTPRVLGDHGRLQQVVWNLLSNAVKFTDPGGAIDITLCASGKHARLTVADNGRGISPAFLPFVFDRFRQSDSSSARRQGGLGLGLALVHDLIELHGGTIRAESAGENRGAKFTIDLPTVMSPEQRRNHVVADAQSTDLPSLAGVRVLLVDDEADARELAVETLMRCGADVVPVSSSAAALQALRDGGRFDVLVSDIGMPKEDGYELIRRVRALDPARVGVLPAVAVTGYANADDCSRALAAGYHVHVPKPMDPAALATAVRQAIEGRGAERGESGRK